MAHCLCVPEDTMMARHIGPHGKLCCTFVYGKCDNAKIIEKWIMEQTSGASFVVPEKDSFYCPNGKHHCPHAAALAGIPKSELTGEIRALDPAGIA